MGRGTLVHAQWLQLQSSPAFAFVLLPATVPVKKGQSTPKTMMFWRGKKTKKIKGRLAPHSGSPSRASEPVGAKPGAAIRLARFSLSSGEQIAVRGLRAKPMVS